MTLNLRSRLVRWTYYLTSKYDMPDTTTLCGFFWRAFVFMPLFWMLVVGGFGTILVAIVLHIILHPWQALNILGVAVLLVGVFLFGAWLYNVEWMEVTPAAVRDSVFVQGLKTLKGKMCPIIYFKFKE